MMTRTAGQPLVTLITPQQQQQQQQLLESAKAISPDQAPRAYMMLNNTRQRLEDTIKDVAYSASRVAPEAAMRFDSQLKTLFAQSERLDLFAQAIETVHGDRLFAEVTPLAAQTPQKP
jgi:hypothetical protein